MQKTYFSSAVMSLGSRGSVSFSSSDCPYLLNERFQRNPLLGSSSQACCCSCCSCCACSISTHRVPINPSYLYGLRQSNLIQWSCSRRLVLGGGHMYFCRIPVNGLDQNQDVYDVSCTVKRSGGDRRIGRRNGRIRCMVVEDEGERYGFGGVDDFEAMISLLSEDIDEECFGGREKSIRGSIRRVEVESRGSDGGERYARKKKNVGFGSLESDSKCKIESVSAGSREESYRRNKERKALSISESSRGRKENVGVTSLQDDDSKHRFESVNTEFKEEDYRQSREREDFSKDENRRMRKEGSAASSYYSFSSSGDFESDVEVQTDHGGLMEESLSGFRKDVRSGEGRFSEAVEEGRHENDSEEHREASRWEKNATSSGVEWDWRKNSEKKLGQVSIEEGQSMKQSTQMYSKRMTRIEEGNYGKASSSRNQSKDEEESLTLVGGSGKGTFKQYSQSESRMKYQERTDEQESGVDKSFQPENKSSASEGKGNYLVTTGDYLKTVGGIGRKYDSRTSSERFTRMSKQQNVTQRTSLQRQSETRMKKLEETSVSVLSSGKETEEQRHLTGQITTKQVDLRKKSQQGYTMMSETLDNNTEKTSILQSDSRMKNQIQNSGVASSLSPEAGGQPSPTDQGVVRRFQSGKGSQDVTNTSLSHSSDSVTVTSSRRSSEKRVTDQETNLTSTVRRAVETRERHTQTDDRVMQLESRTRREAGKSKVSSFRENDSKEASGSGASLDLVLPVGSQKIDAGEENPRSSLARMMPPPAQLVSRGSFHIEPDSRITSSGQGTPELGTVPYGGARRDETERNPSNFDTNEDALDSAYRSQKFSMQYVGEFVEQARHELSTSVIEKEKKVSETTLVHEDENHGQKASSQYSFGDSQLKEHDSRRKSGASGTKGPSDEMWDVTDPSIQESSNEENPEVTIPSEDTSENAIVRRSGRSLWNIIADVARLRWGSRAESPVSAARSGAKSSPDESVGTEAWFSGREHEESSDENAKKKRITRQETTSYEQKLEKSSSSEGEVSDTMRSNDKKKDTDADMSYNPSMIESGSAAISSTSGEENIGSNEDTRFGRTVAESSLSARGSRRSSSIGEMSETGKIDVSQNDSVEQVEQPSNTRLTEILGTEGKDGELKRRRLQREKQVLRESFDDWEEAYKRESEQRKIDEMFMREALLESEKAADAWEVPVGAVLVQNGMIIARGHNLVEELRDSTAHAEMICIREASNHLKTWRLADTTLYVTLEPCPMCAGAILQSRIDTLVWGAPNKLLGADGSWIRLFPGESQSGSEPGDKPAAPVHPFHPNMKIQRGVLAGECADAMQQFFQLRRKKAAKKTDLPAPSSTLAARRHPSKFLSKMQQIFHIMFCL